MTREEANQFVKQINSKSLLLEVGTGVGKTKLALDWLQSKGNVNNILVVVPRLTIIESWKEQLKLWNFKFNVEFSTYVSLKKHTNTIYDAIVYDEAHHFTENVINTVRFMHSEYNVLLSATISYALLNVYKSLFPGIYHFKMSTQDAIDAEVLANPSMILFPLLMDTRTYSESFILNKSGKTEKVVLFGNHYQYFKQKNVRTIVKCTQQQYYDHLSDSVDYYKLQYLKDPNNAILKHKWLYLCNLRLKWLSDIKTETIKRIVEMYKDERILVFCNSIEQTEKVCSNCINSKNKKSQQYLQEFNEGKIDVISAVNCLNEGCNLKNTRIGIWGVLNNSTLMTCQKIGRILRHDEPILIIPYYQNTREEELVTKMVGTFDSIEIEYRYL